MCDPGKAAVIGCGAVGAAVAYTFLQMGIFSELALLDLDSERAQGEADDLCHAMPYTNNMNIYAGEYDDLHDASLVVVTAGATQTPGQTRLDLAGKNRAILRSILSLLQQTDFDGILLLVTNPVDVLTFDAQRILRAPRFRVLGTGTALDSARLRFLLSRAFSADCRDVQALVLGEHGDSSVPVTAGSGIAGIPIGEFFRLKGEYFPDRALYDLLTRVRMSGYEILSRKGATNWGVAAAVGRIACAIARDERAILPVSVCLRGEYGLDHVALSVPCVLCRNGVERIIEVPLSPREEAMLSSSAQALREVIDAETATVKK